MRPRRIEPVAAPEPGTPDEMRTAPGAGWPAMLTALETVDIDGVDLKAVEIVTAERSIRVDAAFPDLATLLRFIDELNAGEPMPRWAVVQASREPGGTGSARGAEVARVAGTVRATW